MASGGQPNNGACIVHNNFGPYHLARLEAAAKLGTAQGYKVVGLELASRHLHPWSPAARPGTEKYTIFPHRDIAGLKPWQLARGAWSALNRLNPQAVAMGLSKETAAAFLAILLWARLKKRTAVILMDSKYDDFPRSPQKERIKRLIMSRLDGALVGGTSSREYAESLGIPADNILVGCDVVDNGYFAGRADWARENAARLLKEHGLPDNYFLFVGRLDEKKNIPRLLEAYAIYRKNSSKPAWHLVLCGSGPMEEKLRRQARRLDPLRVHFCGFKQVDELPIFYGLASCLLFPSLGDTWGLIVNEAMASGLPVLVSRACGCAPDLVRDGVNGFTFDPMDIEALARLMGQMSNGQVDLSAMGQASRRLIAHWGLETYAENLFKVLRI
jgi:1,2-diacylglycerol 3-alpha-glucosyltransferase